MIRLWVLLALLWAAPAMAGPCPALPATISAPCTIVADGSYLLSGTVDGSALEADDPAIEIGSGVTLANINCNGYRIDNNGPAYSNDGIGIGGVNVANVTIENCQFTGSGMAQCVHIDNEPGGWAYQNVTIKDSVCQATWRGFHVRSHGVKYLRNYMVNIGGHSNCTGGGYYTFAMEFYGHNAEVRENRIRRVWNRCYSEVVGIGASGYAVNATIVDNRIENDRVANTQSLAVWIGWNGGPFTISGNVIDRWHYGFLAGYIAAGTLAGTSLISNVAVPLYGIDPPGWVVSP